MSTPDLLIGNFTKIIMERIFCTIGEKNIVSIILLGSVARNQASFRYINGNLFLESDMDIVVVINRKAFLKSLILIKRIANKLTTELRKKGLLSSVSLSVMTEQYLLNVPPWIIIQDIYNNGKVIFGKKFSNLLPFTVHDIPQIDVYRLLFNRMVEALEGLVQGGILEYVSKTDNFDLAPRSIEKLTFCLIQALLINDDKLVFRGITLPDLKIACDSASKNRDILTKLLKNYEIILETKNQNNYSASLFKKSWQETILQFKTTLEIVAGITIEQKATLTKFLMSHEELNHRIKSSAAIFLQYCGLRRTINLLGAIYFIIKNGKDGIYLPLYTLFLSSTIFTQPYEIAPDSSDSHKLTENMAYTRKKWLDSFNKYFSYWKFITGG